MRQRRFALMAMAFLGSLGMAGCSGKSASPLAKPVVPDDKSAFADMALSRARAFLISKMAPDGTWRSDTYKLFQDGSSLTPLVLLALHGINDQGEPNPAMRAGTDYLVTFVRPDGTIDADGLRLNYPVYTAALAVSVLSRRGNERHRAARDAWLTELRRRQLDESLGWEPSDAPYGGWGYCHTLPRKPRPGEFVPPLVESNLSATVFALDALHDAGLPTSDPAIQRALVFVGRCQNLADDATKADPKYDDGGFHFIYDDPARNKPGPAGEDATGRLRFRSYGSTTADGYRALRLCGLPVDHPRVDAAGSWLNHHFDGSAHVGDYPPERRDDKDAVYFYYAWSFAQSLKDWPANDARAKASALADGLMARQRPDGSWSNPKKAVREDDSILATAFATAALAWCRLYLP